jgi:phosphoribosylpyrophosphate synthetase
VDGLVTIDPHLHRYASLDEIYRVPSRLLHAAPMLADWIRDHVDRPLLVGPDEESAQWVADVAGRAGAPHAVLRKTGTATGGSPRRCASGSTPSSPATPHASNRIGVDGLIAGGLLDLLRTLSA